MTVLRASLSAARAGRTAQLTPARSGWRELPVLLLRGTRDNSTDMDETLALRKLFGAAGSELTELSGAGKKRCPSVTGT